MLNIIIGTTPTKDFTKVALTLQNADGTIIENRAFETLYEGE